MQELRTQAEFETLWLNKENTSPWIVYFTKDDCAPCCLLDKAAILVAAGDIPFYMVNLSVNKYTPGFCSITRFPTFVIIRNQGVKQRIIAILTSSNTENVCKWLTDFREIQ